MVRMTQPHHIKEWRKLLKLTAQQVADGIGRDKGTVSKIENFKQSYTQETLNAIAAVFKHGIKASDLLNPPPDSVEKLLKSGVAPLRENIPVDNSQPDVVNRNQGGVTLVPGARPALVRDLPIRGHTKAGATGFFIDQGQTWGFAMRPESLRGVDSAYAVRVQDDCMSPRYEPGELLLVDPFRHAKPGDYVIIQLKDGQAFVKRLERRAGGIVACSQLNPKKAVEWKAEKVKSIHLVVGVDYLER